MDFGNDFFPQFSQCKNGYLRWNKSVGTKSPIHNTYNICGLTSSISQKQFEARNFSVYFMDW